MGVTIVIGAQWGDEGKGKIVDLLARDFDFVVRFHGGPNAGHTVRVGEKVLKLHHIPSAVLREDCTLVIANGVVVDPQILIGEIADLKRQGIDLAGRLVVSQDCHLILPYHRMLEGYFASLKDGKMDTKSTGRGIGPSHADKVQYLGIKVGDLYRLPTLWEKLRVNLTAKQAVLGEREELRGLPYEFGKWAAELEPFVGETVGMLHRALDQNARILMEGAQGTFLDVDHGFYPFVTASNAVAGAINAGAGIPPRAISFIWGITKAYVTRVGDSPFPTEITGGLLAETIQERGGERGTTTGRLRKVGWFDAEMVRVAAKLSGFDALALTKIDVLSGLPQLELATGIRESGSHRDLSYLTERNPEVLFRAEPQYVSFEPWSEDLTKIRNFARLPWRVTDYVEAIEQLTDVPVRIVSVGPDREQTIFR